MNTIFMNSENSKTSDPHIPLLNPKNKINYKEICNLKKVINMLLFQILAYILYMDWRVWITWWTKFYIRFSRLFWIYIKKW